MDVFDEIPQLIKSLETHPRFGAYARTLVSIVPTVPQYSCVNDKKVTDHHALLITGNPARDLPDDDKTIYEMVAGRMLEAFSAKCIKDATTITFTCGDSAFETKGSVIKQAGWRRVFDVREDIVDGETDNLPEIRQGEQLPIGKTDQTQAVAYRSLTFGCNGKRR